MSDQVRSGQIRSGQTSSAELSGAKFDKLRSANIITRSDQTSSDNLR